MPKKSNGKKKEKITLETVRHVARLARLELSESELARFQKDLNDVLFAFRELDRAPAKAKPSFQPLPIKDIMREDIVEQPIGQGKALANTKHKEKGFFIGPRAV